MNAFSDGEVKLRVFQSLDLLSQTESKRRGIRDAEENETGTLVGMLNDVLPQLRPLDQGRIDYDDPDGLLVALQKAERLPHSVKKKSLSRMLNKALEISSVPRPFGNGTKRMYAVNAKKLEEYRKRYADGVRFASHDFRKRAG